MLLLILAIIEEKIKSLKNQGHKNLIIALATGIGTIFCALIGLLLRQLLNDPLAFYWGFVISSFAIIPASILLALSIWRKVKFNWATSDDFIKRMQFLDDQRDRELEIIDKLKISEIDKKKECKIIYSKYKRSKELIEVEYLPKSDSKSLDP